MSGRDCTTLVLRPSPTKPTNARKRSVDPVDTPIDLSRTMSSWMKHKITESEIDADMNEKRHELEQSRFQHEVERQHKNDADVEKRARAEVERDEKRFKLEGQRLEHEREVRKDELALRHRELKLREDCEKNRSSEAKELAKMTYENQKQTTDMMLSILKLAMENKGK